VMMRSFKAGGLIGGNSSITIPYSLILFIYIYYIENKIKYIYSCNQSVSATLLPFTLHP